MKTLTPREKQTAALLKQGATNSEISEIMDIELITAKSHVNNVCKKLGVKSRTQAVVVMMNDELNIIRKSYMYLYKRLEGKYADILDGEDLNKFVNGQSAEIGRLITEIEILKGEGITRGSGDVFKDMGLEQAPFPTLKGKNNG